MSFVRGLCLGWAVWSIGCIGNSLGGIVLDQDVDGLGLASEVLIDGLVPYYRSLTSTKFRFEARSNATIMMLKSSEMQELCRLIRNGQHEELRAKLNGTNAFLTPEADFTCGGFFGLKESRRYIQEWCKFVPITIFYYTDWELGILSNYRTMSDKDILDWIDDGNPCFHMQATNSPQLLEFEKSMDASLFFKVSMSEDENVGLKVLDSWIVQILFRGFPFVGFFVVSLISARILKARLACGKWTAIHVTVLGLNLLQGLVLGILTQIGTHFITSTLIGPLQIILTTDLFGLSVTTDLLFASMLSEIRNNASFSKVKRSSRMQKLVLGIGLFIAALDFVVSTTFILTNQSPLGADILMIYFPAVLFLIGLGNNIYIMVQVRMIGKLLMNVASHMTDEGQASASRRLAKLYYFWSKVSLFSSFLSYITFFMSFMGWLFSSMTFFLLSITLIHVSKFLNLLSQSKSCTLIQQDSESTAISQRRTFKTVAPSSRASALRPIKSTSSHGSTATVLSATGNTTSILKT